MKSWFAEVIELGCDFLCVLLGHFHGCFLLNSRWSPLCRAYRWAVLTRWDATGPHAKWAERTEEPEITNDGIVTTCSGGTNATYVVDMRRP